MHACKHGGMFEANAPLLQSVTMQRKLNDMEFSEVTSEEAS